MATPCQLRVIESEQQSMKNKPLPSTDPSVAQIKRDWDQLRPIDRAERVAKIKRRGHSNRDIGRNLDVPESTLRSYLLALQAPAEDIELARQGKLSISQLVRRAKAEAHRRGAIHREALQKKQKQLAREGAELICDWLRKLNLQGSYGEQIIGEAHRIIAKESLEGTLPRVDPPVRPVQPAIIIERCKPKDPLDDSIQFVGWYGEWLARWVVFAFPDPDVRDLSLENAKRQQYGRATPLKRFSRRG